MVVTATDVVDEPARHVPVNPLMYVPGAHAVKPLTRRLYSKNRTIATRIARTHFLFITLITGYYSHGSGGVARDSISLNSGSWVSGLSEEYEWMMASSRSSSLPSAI